MTITHCLTSGSLGSGEIPVCNISTSTMSAPMIPAGGVGHGNVRGVVLLMTGLSLVPLSPPYVITNTGGVAMLTLANALVADGWIVTMPPFNETSLGAGALITVGSNPASFIQTDVTNDTGHGSRMLNANLHWFDHITNWLGTQGYGTFPLVPFGVSWGGWHSWIAGINRTANIIAYGGHCGVTILSDVSSSFTIPANWTIMNSTGANVASTGLNSIAIPGFIGWSTLDTVVGDTDLMAMYNAAHTAGAPVTFLSDTTNAHGLYTTDIGPGGTGFTGTTIMDWFTTTVDPLAPKAH